MLISSCDDSIQVDPDYFSNVAIKGVIIDSFYNYPLPDVEVSVPSQSIKAYSDSIGNYLILIKSVDSLTVYFSDRNYRITELKLSNVRDTTINIVLVRKNYNYVFIDENELPPIESMDSTYFYYDIFYELQFNMQLFLKHDLYYRNTKYDSLAVDYYLDSLISYISYYVPNVEIAWYKSMTSWCGPQQVRDNPYLVIKLDKFGNVPLEHRYKIVKGSGISWKTCLIGNYEFRKYVLN